MKRRDMIGAGEMRHRVRIEADITGEQNTLGEVVRNMQPIDEVWAAIETGGGVKALGGDQPQGLITMIVKTRFHPNLVAARRLSYKGRTFEISRVVNVDERDRELHLVCKETVPV